ncbi:chromosome segregation protein SMC [Geomesophilobacter sediminis]|uniref:Chromosome partition protein Smc n=1 Tax=Geomesophilobacter sediminis TaxID=2798584 RepID=A0A8J7JMH0_9BACT|nr:chromosome segregation protein SMC [Geomesophilobacter sediminis]MBJ6725825.1 chromosome segregation protein SMC [Geomesophilobacter sediminis]
MKIKRLEILGFKSFQDKVSLEFNQAITSIVGPNGCGKSNVVDAIRWVMGEQSAKNLRGKAMEDIIFNGTEYRKPLGMAEVSLVFSTEDGRVPAKYLNFTEIQVTRRLYRDGESDYLINKIPCRLLDVAELFMDTGIGARAYSIIEQGKIGMILHAKPEERRFLIEEAAGVTKFKARKVVALKKIESTRQNLLRIGDIVTEIKRQMNGLQRQAKRAERFREVRQELREIELGFAAKGHRKLQEERKTLEQEVAKHQEAFAALSASLSSAEMEIEKRKFLLAETERQLAAAQEEIFRLKGELQGGENRLEFQRRELANLEKQGERFREELEGLKSQLAAAQAELVALSDQERSLQTDLAREAEELENREALLEEMTLAESSVTRELDEARRAVFTAISESTQAGNQIVAGEKRLAGLSDRIAANQRERVLLGERLAEASDHASQLTGELDTLNRRKTESEEELLLLNSREVELRKAQEACEKELAHKREELSGLSSRLKSLKELEEQLAGYGQGVRSVLLADRFKGIPFTLLADAIEVEEAYEVPVESVLGERLQYLLCTSSNHALDALNHLKGNGGRASFVTAPPVHFGAPAAAPQCEPLLAKVKVKRDLAPYIEPLLAGAYLAADLQDALKKGESYPGCCFVTPDGDTVHAGGILNGGSPEAAGPGIIHKKREIRELTTRVTELGEEVEALAAAREKRREEIKEVEAERGELRQALHRLEIQIVNTGKDRQSRLAEQARLEENASIREMEEDQLTEERESVTKELAEVAARKAAAEERKVQLEQNVEALMQRLQGSRFEIEEARELVTSLKVRVAALKEKGESVQRGRKRVEGLTADLTARITTRSKDLEGAGGERGRLEKAIQEGESAIAATLKNLEKAEQALVAVRERFEADSTALREEETRLKGGNSEAIALRDGINAGQLRLSELAMQVSHLEETLSEKYRMQVGEVLDRYGRQEWDETERGSRRAELQKVIDEMGEVNLMAIDEFKAMEERYDFLSAQKVDLEESMNSLQKAIQKINRTTRKRFLETFQLVNEKFQQIFPRLFCGGHAELRLTDEEDLLTTGLEIVVQPPGKKLQNVSLLSGGEKALTAVALIFSIFLIKPSPFCLLDEVDAPLDDANIGRFNEMVREMSANSQFIIITHNRSTMAVADTLYGVTMEEPGVSKLVSVRLNC